MDKRRRGSSEIMVKLKFVETKWVKSLSSFLERGKERRAKPFDNCFMNPWWAVAIAPPGNASIGRDFYNESDPGVHPPLRKCKPVEV